jgi:hypothetical protein
MIFHITLKISGGQALEADTRNIWPCPLNPNVTPLIGSQPECSLERCGGNADANLRRDIERPFAGVPEVLECLCAITFACGRLG